MSTMDHYGYIWATFYAGLMSIQMHPRNALAAEDMPLLLSSMASVADRMLLEYKERFTWHG